MRVGNSGILTMLVLSLLACGPATASPRAHARHVAHHGWMARNADIHHAWLYVDREQGGGVLIYDLDRVGVPQIGQIVDGLSTPTGLALDAAGTLYVSNYGGANVQEYSAGSTSPSVTLTQGITVPNGLAVDANGDLYVANKTPDSVLVFPQGQTSPSRTIVSPLITNPGQLFIDTSRNLYVGLDTGVTELPYPGQQPVDLGLQGCGQQFASVAVDPLDNDLFVGCKVGSKATILEYAAGSSTPERTLRATLYADFLAFGDIKHKEYMFAPDSSGSVVDFFREGRRKPAFQLPSFMYVRGVAYKPPGMP